MVNIIWGFLLVVGIVYSFFTGNISNINDEILLSAKDGIELILTIMPTLIIWMGLMEIAQKSGLLEKFALLMTPILSKLFPSVPKGNKAVGLIASNVVVNMMGLGSAATPFGLKAMEELQKINDKKDTASEAMITFLILNTAGVTIVPTTIVSLRLMHGSVNPTSVILPCILATMCSSLGGLTLDYFIRKRKKK